MNFNYIQSKRPSYLWIYTSCPFHSIFLNLDQLTKTSLNSIHLNSWSIETHKNVSWPQKDEACYIETIIGYWKMKLNSGGIKVASLQSLWDFRADWRIFWLKFQFWLADFFSVLMSIFANRLPHNCTLFQTIQLKFLLIFTPKLNIFFHHNSKKKMRQLQIHIYINFSTIFCTLHFIHVWRWPL